MSVSDRPEENIRMTPEQERAAMETAQSEEGTEPADEGIGVHSDADDDGHTEN